MIIRAKNDLHLYAPVTYLTNPEVSGTNILRWKNAAGFNASWAMQVGEVGEEQTEIVLLGASTPAGTAGTLTANTLFEHPTETPLYGIKYDQVVFERSTAGTAGTAIPMASGTVTYQADSPYTIFDDTTGSSTYAYRTYFRSSVLNVTTTESDWITSAGFSFYSLAKIRQRVLDKLVSSGYLPDTSLVDDWTNEWLELLTNAAIDVNEDYAIGTTSLTYTGTQELGTITNSDFKQLRRVWWADPTGTSPMTKMEQTNYFPAQTFNTTLPYFYMQGDTIMGRRPSDSTGTALIVYYKLNPVLVNDTDELPTPMKGYSKSFVNYGLSQALFKDSKTEEAKEKLNEALMDKERFVKELTPRNKTGPTYTQIVEAVSAEDIPWFF